MPTGQANRLMPTLRRVVLARQSAARSDGELLGAFVNERDADAFAELVRRHGSMVLGVCRRVVGDHATADDAFQAAFLVLARRAAGVRPREQVGNWLYGVAYRTALKARMVLARRRAREKQVDVMPEPIATAAATDWSDLQVVIDEELAKLPDKLRLPVVLCDIEGRPQREVAKHLKVPPATLATRLASARRTLAQRLTRRGVVLSGGALAGLLGAHASASAVPPTLAAGAAHVGEAVASGSSLGSIVSAPVVQLSEGVMRMMMLAKLKAVAVMVATALVLTTGLGLGLVPATAGDEPTPGSNLVLGMKAAPAAKPTPSDAQPAAPKDGAKPAAPVDDATFLRRLCLDVRGDLPTPVETWFFVSDDDNDKRAKVVDWLVADEEVKVVLAKKLGVPVERIKVVRARLSADGKSVELALGEPDKPQTLAFTPDGNWLVAGATNQLYSLYRTQTGEKVTYRPLVAWLTAADPNKSVINEVYDKYVVELVNDPSPSLQLWSADGDKQPENRYTRTVKHFFTQPNSDAEFLKRVLADVRGSRPTALELKYFTEDKDPKKREKLLDTLLKDPAVQKKLGDAWKQKMLSFQVEVLPPKHGYFRSLNLGANDHFYLWQDGKLQPFTPESPVIPAPTTAKPLAPPVPSKFEKLVDELIAAQKSDEAILEALTLAAMGRLPTGAEKKLTLPGIATTKDRKAAWVAVAKSLAGTNAKVIDVQIEDTFRFKLKPEQPAPPAKP